MRIPSIILRAAMVGLRDRGATSVEYALIAVADRRRRDRRRWYCSAANLLGLYDETASSYADAT